MHSHLKNPPPGTYNPSDQDSMSGYGTYILSGLKTVNTKRIQQMSNAKTPEKGAHEGLHTRITTPGPGTYLIPSDFGIPMPPKTSLGFDNSMLDAGSELDLSRINMSEMRKRPNNFNMTELDDIRAMACRSKQESVPVTMNGGNKRSLEGVLAQTM